MINALVLVLLAANPNPEFRQPDGGVTVRVWCDGVPVSGGGGSGGFSYVNAVIDAGRLDVNNFPATYPITDNGGSITVDGTFYQATQPVSLASVPSHAVTLASTTITGSVATTGTYFQATQPVSMVSVPTHGVTGTFFQATQPVSGTLTCNAGTGTLAVSGPLTDTQLRATAVPVSGTVGVSGSVAVSGPLTDAQLRATAVPVSGSVTATVASTSANQGTANTAANRWPIYVANGGSELGTGGTGTGLTVTCTNCGGSVTPALYQWIVPSTAVGASKVFLDLFNGAGSGKVMKIIGIHPIVDTDVAVVGVVGIRIVVLRTTTVGTAGTVWVLNGGLDVAGGSLALRDSNDAAVPAQITGRHLPTGGGTTAAWIRGSYLMGEEASTSMAYIAQGQLNMIGDNNLVVREGQGIKISQGAVASVGNVRFRVVFTLE